MGNAHSLVINKTHKKICIITFNQADLLYTSKPDITNHAPHPFLKIAIPRGDS